MMRACLGTMHVADVGHGVRAWSVSDPVPLLRCYWYTAIGVGRLLADVGAVVGVRLDARMLGYNACRRRPYRVECTGSLPTSEVKRRRARLVLGWGTAWEHLRVLSAFVANLLRHPSGGVPSEYLCRIERPRRVNRPPRHVNYPHGVSADPHGVSTSHLGHAAVESECECSRPPPFPPPTHYPRHAGVERTFWPRLRKLCAASSSRLLSELWRHMLVAALKRTTTGEILL